MTGKLLLLDSASMYFRAFHGVPESVTAPDGTPVNAVRGFLDFIAKVVNDRRPGRLVACMDATWRPEFRVAAIPSYKAHRLAPNGREEVVPPGLVPQVPVIEDVLEAIGLTRIGVDGFEADDVIGTLAARDPGPVEVVSGDRDLLQVVDDSRGVAVWSIIRGVAKAELWTEATVAAKYGIPGRAYADFAALRGDPSDGLPGVNGIGEKTAATLVSRFGSLAGILEALDDPKADLAPGVRMKLRAAADYVAAAPGVVAVRTDVPLPAYDDTLPTAPADPERLVELADRWGLDSSVNRVLNALSRERTESH